MLAFKQSNFEQGEIFFFGGGGEGEGKRSGRGGREAMDRSNFKRLCYQAVFCKVTQGQHCRPHAASTSFRFLVFCFVDKSMTPEWTMSTSRMSVKQLWSLPRLLWDVCQSNALTSHHPSERPEPLRSLRKARRRKDVLNPRWGIRFLNKNVRN